MGGGRTSRRGSPTRTRTSNLAVNPSLGRTHSTEPCAQLLVACAALQTALAAHRCGACFEFLLVHELPRPTRARPAGFAGLVLLKPPRQVLGRPDVEPP